MRHALNITLLPALATFLSSISLSTLAAIPATFAFADAIPLEPVLSPFGNELPNISKELFFELEELARLVDIAYCVGSAGTGVYKPFECISRCSDFEGFELVTVRLPPLP